MMSALKTEAEVLRRCLDLGVVERRDVIAWADARIAQDDPPDVSITDVALAVGRSAADLSSLLRGVPGTPDRAAYLRGVFGQMRILLMANPTALRLVAHALYLMVLDDEYPSAEAKGAMHTFDDAIELARGGVLGDLNKIRAEVLRFLDDFSADVVPG